MNTPKPFQQNQIKHTLSDSSNIAYVCGLLENGVVRHRNELAEQVCKHFGFYDIRGRLQRGGCVKALRDLEATGHFILPKVCTSHCSHSPRRLSEPVPAAVDVPARVEDVQELELVWVTTLEQRRIWNEMMINEHPQKAVSMAGRQLRYLIYSRHGILGGFGFAASALQLADRDAWIGWDGEMRRNYLHYVVGMSRFLIRPCVQCHNLASKVLGMSMATLPVDFECRYGYKPWLIESFVDTKMFTGACYRAANWICVGKTKGRGRQDRQNKSELSQKDIYLYPIAHDFRQQMGLSPNAGLGALNPTDGLETEMWAEHEFGNAPLGDARLKKRLVSVAAAKAQAPGQAFSGVAKGDWPTTQAYYRMIDQPDKSEVSMDNILIPHRTRTVRRMMGQKTVLCIQDGSNLNYDRLDKCTGLGDIGSNQTDAVSRGLHFHSTFVVAPNGLPLGALKVTCEAPTARNPEDTRPASAIPIEEKKSFVWIKHHRDMVEVASQMPGVRIVDVCDREADFFEFFEKVRAGTAREAALGHEQRQHPRVELLVRAKHNRNIIDNPLKMFAAVHQTPVLSHVGVSVPRQSARTKKSKQQARAKRPGRMAQMALRIMRVKLRPAHYHAEKAPMNICLVNAREENPPANCKPIEWFLLTTMDVNSGEDAERCLRWYCLRWRIEDWHRVLKSGCRIEHLAHKSAERLRRAIAINVVIAWRIMLMTLLGRETPERPAEVLFSDVELRTLHAWAKKTLETACTSG